MISGPDKGLLLGLARGVISARLSGKTHKVDDEIKNKFSEKRGVFVSLHIGNELRGCIGFVLPVYPIWQGICQAALAAAFEDPRFPPLSKGELEKVKIEISLLTEPKPIKGKEDIEIGKHGLIIQHRGRSGLLLPQVATEYGWGVEEFLNHLCLKAGLMPGEWRQAQLQAFEAEVFSE